MLATSCRETISVFFNTLIVVAEGTLKTLRFATSTGKTMLCCSDTPAGQQQSRGQVIQVLFEDSPADLTHRVTASFVRSP